MFWLMVTGIACLAPLLARMPDLITLVLQLLLWIAIWLVVAYGLTDHRDALPAPFWLFFIQLGIALAAIALLWAPPPPPAEQRAPSRRQLSLNWAIRLLLFVGVFLLLLATAQNASDPKWVGMASALPLPGLFALAHLSTRQPGDQLRPIRDTVLLGPLLVIPFNWLFAALVMRLPPGLSGAAMGLAALLTAWASALALVYWLAPKLARCLDG
jgi:hypothetical protein